MGLTLNVVWNTIYIEAYAQRTQKVNAVVILCLVLLFGFSPSVTAQNDQVAPADFELDTGSIEITADCISPILLIKWTNREESNVTGFKVHSRSQPTNPNTPDPSTVENRWLNTIAIVAKGADKQYTIIDSSFAPNTVYKLRLYGFEQNNLLSKAKQFTLDDAFAIHCTSLPIIIR